MNKKWFSQQPDEWILLKSACGLIKNREAACCCCHVIQRCTLLLQIYYRDLIIWLTFILSHPWTHPRCWVMDCQCTLNNCWWTCWASVKVEWQWTICAVIANFAKEPGWTKLWQQPCRILQYWVFFCRRWSIMLWNLILPTLPKSSQEIQWN